MSPVSSEKHLIINHLDGRQEDRIQVDVHGYLLELRTFWLVDKQLHRAKEVTNLRGGRGGEGGRGEREGGGRGERVEGGGEGRERGERVGGEEGRGEGGGGRGCHEKRKGL